MTVAEAMPELDVVDRSDRAFLGHPKGLGYLAFTEAWERFSYYGMQALLVLYLVNYLLLPANVGNVAFFDEFRTLYGGLDGQPLASAIVGTYFALVYLTPILGGLLADRVLGAHCPPAQPAAAARPSVNRVFARASKMLVQLHIYNAAGGAASPDLEMSLRVLDRGREVLGAPPHKVSTAGSPDPARVRYAAEIPLRALAPGASALRLRLTLYYCREDNTGVCRIKTLAWRAPVEVTADPSAPREIKLEAKVD
jgi:hypothetical protein